jgi:hypothetical protein
MQMRTFYTEKEVKKIVKEQFTLLEFSNTLQNIKPKELFHHHYSQKTPLIIIEQYS